MAQVILSAALAAAVAVRLIATPDIGVTDGHVRLMDVADVSGANARALGGIEIARVPGDVAAVPIARAKLASLIERAIPGAQIVGDLEGSITLHSTTASPTTVAPPP